MKKALFILSILGGAIQVSGAEMAQKLAESLINCCTSTTAECCIKAAEQGNLTYLACPVAALALGVGTIKCLDNRAASRDARLAHAPVQIQLENPHEE